MLRRRLAVESGISYAAFFNAARSLYDENMAHQNYQLGRLVERLKARGEWGHTLVIVAADHGSAAAHVPDPFPRGWGPLFTSSVTRVPLIVVWPERIAPGQRFSQPLLLHAPRRIERHDRVLSIVMGSLRCRSAGTVASPLTGRPHHIQIRSASSSTTSLGAASTSTVASPVTSSSVDTGSISILEALNSYKPFGTSTFASPRSSVSAR